MSVFPWILDEYVGRFARFVPFVQFKKCEKQLSRSDIILIKLQYSVINVTKRY